MPSRIAALERMLASDPADAFVLYGLATEHAKLGHLDVAIRYFDDCLAADPLYLYAHYHKAKTLADHDRAADAISVLNLGITAAKAARDSKALSELQTLLDSLS
jgi:tetratricopeptide (TPR) repeat protein